MSINTGASGGFQSDKEKEESDKYFDEKDAAKEKEDKEK
jgi:hypothetical protein